MISKSNIESAIILANKLRAEGKVIYVKGGTLLDLLQSETREVPHAMSFPASDLEQRNYGNIIDQISFLLNRKSSEEGPIPSDHDIVMQGVLPALNTYIRSNVDFTKRVVLPTLKRVTEHVSNAISNNTSGVSEETFFNIKPVVMPEFGKGEHLDFLKSELANIPEIKEIPEMNIENLIYGNEQNATFYKGKADTRFQHYVLVTRDPHTLNKILIDHIKEDGYEGLQETYNQIVVLNGIRNEPYWDSKVSTKDNVNWVNSLYKRKLVSLLGMLTTIETEMKLGRVVSSLTPNYETLTIRVVSGIHNRLPTIYVYENELHSIAGKDNATKFLLGYMLTDKFVGVLETRTFDKDMTEVYIQTWETNKDNIIISEKNQITNNIISAILDAHKVIIEEEGLILQDKNVWKMDFKSERELVEHLQYAGINVESGDIFEICLGYISFIFNYSDAIEYIRCMDKFLNDPDTLNPTHTSAYIHAIQTLLVKYMKEQFQIDNTRD